MILFDSNYQPAHEQGEHVVVLPPRLESKTALLSFFREALRLPDYFGDNWDALEECLADLPGPGRTVLVHHDLPLEADAAGQRIYLKILRAVARDETRLTAVFPETYRKRLAATFDSA